MSEHFQMKIEIWVWVRDIRRSIITFIGLIHMIHSDLSFLHLRNRPLLEAPFLPRRRCPSASLRSAAGRFLIGCCEYELGVLRPLWLLLQVGLLRFLGLCLSLRQRCWFRVWWTCMNRSSFRWRATLITIIWIRWGKFLLQFLSNQREFLY